MADELKYLVTVNARSQEIVKVERLGEAGDLQEVPVGTLDLGRSRPQPPMTSYTLNFFMGSGPMENRLDERIRQEDFSLSNDIPPISNQRNRGGSGQGGGTKG